MMSTDKYIGTAGCANLVFLSFQNVNLKVIGFESVTVTHVPT